MKEGYRILGTLPSFVLNFCKEQVPQETTMHVIVENHELISLLSWLNREFSYMIRKEFKSPFIVNSFSYLNNTEPNFYHEIHRDIRFFSGEVPLMFNLLIMLDDFTEENGATWLMPGSHLLSDKPTDEEFNKTAKQITGKAGDVVLWNSNLWHRAGINHTTNPRRAFAITLSKSCLKQLLDYPRALGNIHYPEDIRQLLGYHSRVPASLEEWNGERTYHKHQD